MPNNWFKFKKFIIHHDRCAMKVGTDGVMLGAWCDVGKTSRVLDIGTGSGLIALMVAQRNLCCLIDAVEIDGPSARQAEENVAISPWAERVNIINSPFGEFFSSKKLPVYDLIVSNPPWFINSLTNPDPGRSVARHADSLTMDELLEGVSTLLSSEGRLCLIMPVQESQIFIEKASGMDLHCRKITSVHPNPGKPPKRYLMELSRIPGETIKESIVIELGRRHEYSPEFKELTKEFYLYFRY